METRNFFIENCEVQGFYKEIRWNRTENSFFLSVGNCLIDFLMRFYGTEETKKVLNAFEYDLGQFSQSSAKLGKEMQRQFEAIKVFSQGFIDMKNVDKVEKLECLYKYLRDNKDFANGMAEFFKGLLIKNKIIESQIEIGKIQSVLEYFYSRYRMVIAIYLDGNWVKIEAKNEFGIFCALKYSDGFRKLLIKDAHANLENSMTEFKFPYIFKPNWKELIEELKQESERYQEYNEKLLKLLNEIVLQVPLSADEEDLILEEYHKSGMICEELEFLKLRKISRPGTMRISNICSKTCDKCRAVISELISIECFCHIECMSCRIKSFASNFTSTCTTCNRILTAEELTVLNSYIKS